jgi:hypothetical protein
MISSFGPITGLLAIHKSFSWLCPLSNKCRQIYLLSTFFKKEVTYVFDFTYLHIYVYIC